MHSHAERGNDLLCRDTVPDEPQPNELPKAAIFSGIPR
jgi:hypothetical protein